MERNNLHQAVFEFLESYRANHPKFLYCFRERNKNNRLKEGLWFQGTEDYAFIGLYNASGGSNMTRSIGLVFNHKKDDVISLGFQVVFNEEKDDKLLGLYKDIIGSFGEFKQVTKTRFDKILSDENPFVEAEKFLNELKPEIDRKVKEAGLDKIFISPAKFEKNLTKIHQFQKELIKSENQKTFILANVTWNSNDWKGESEDPSGHGWVKEGGVPHESWNFDFENPRNSETEIIGYAKFTNPPKVDGNNNLIIFYSKNTIVGFYGKAQILKPADSFNDNNLLGFRSLCIGLEKKIQNVKEKGYLEDKLRIGQGGFNYLNKIETIDLILHEALILNPQQALKINSIREWVGIPEKPKPNFWLFQGNPKVYDFHRAITANALKSWSVNSHKKKIKIGDKVIIWLTGKVPGCYALATVSSSLFYRDDDKEEAEFYTDGKGVGEGNAVEISIDYNLSKAPIQIDSLKKLPEFSSFNAGTQGTNFTATKEQYETILKLINMGNSEDIPLNQIFFGPPGTGKTFSTVAEAIRIVDPVFFQANKDKRDKMKKRFNELLIEDFQSLTSQISFCTFHQSFSYEDFVEGIKPETTDGNALTYRIESGIFKKICELAESNEVSTKIENEGMLNWSKDKFGQANFWKISLGDTSKKEDFDIYNFCINEDKIALGFTKEIDFSSNNLEEIKLKCKNGGYNGIESQQVNYFINDLKHGDYVFVSKGNKYVRALGKIVGEYEFNSNSEIDYQHFRTVEWRLFN